AAAADGTARRTADGTPDPYGTLSARWRALLLGGGFDPARPPFAARLAALGDTARRHRAAMAPAAGSLWPDLPLTRSASITAGYARLSTIAQAVCRPGTGLTGDPAAAADVAAGLDHLGRHAYHPSAEPAGNWWDFQIGAPQALLDCCALLGGLLPADRLGAHLAAVDHFVPDAAVGDYSGTSTGANRVDLCRVLALRGVLGRDPGKLALARDALTPVFAYVTDGDGLYADGSFVQHGHVAYTGSYGAVLLEGVARLLVLLRGTPWAVTTPARRHLFDAVRHAYAPFVHNGLVMDVVAGRAASRGVRADDPLRVQADDHLRGHGLIASVLLLAEAADPADRAAWRRMAKGWLERDRYRPPADDPALGIAPLARLCALLADPAVAAAPEPVGHRLFPAMARAVHRRPGWTAALSMASHRIAHYEHGNGENPRGWHTGSGMLCWWADGAGDGPYTDAFWPTADPYRLPGTTVSARRLADGAGGAWGACRPDARWVGGVTDGTYAAVGQDLRGLESTLTARKAWFFLDDAVVCLTAAVSAADGAAVETVVDHRDLGAGGPRALTVDGADQPAAWGRTLRFRGARWAHVADTAGYVLLDGTALHALRETRTGRWRDINTAGSPEPVTRCYLTLYVDHGTDPRSGRCAYALLPGASRAATAARAADPRWVTLLANTGDRQGVRAPALGLTAVAFWTAGAAGPLAASGPAAVLLRVRGRTAALYVADPTCAGTAVDVTWAHPVRAVLRADPGVTVLGTGPALRLRVAVAGAAGASLGCEVALMDGPGHRPGRRRPSSG
ncbi:polysaccharide lyase 8 family protein, partial [Streptomyces sp. B1866]|uniref:polysaccharide lyase 8 family protein n=1 Tax=Streptomyces sp. B1866 TaxID=3075431 RepID=UPI00288FC455